MQRHVGVLLDQQDGDPLLVDLPDDLEDIPHDQRRQPQRRLIHHDKLGAAHQRAGHRQHLLLAAGKGTGLLHPKSGSILFNGKDLRGIPAHKIVKQGMAQVPEGRHIFLQMTVQENLEMGAFTQPNSAIEADIENVYQRFPRLKERRKQIAGTLSGGEQQMLAMGRALMSHPKLLMLDEPSMGLAPILVEQIFSIIQELHAGGTTILLVEQNAQAALDVADRAYVLETGKISMEGPADELLHNDAVRKAYLGS